MIAIGQTFDITCGHCKSSVDDSTYCSTCPRCGGLLRFTYLDGAVDNVEAVSSMWKYARLLPVNDTSKIVTLSEGGTPLIRARAGQGTRLFLKNETVNPTGSHKDRALSIAMTKAVEFGLKTSMLYSDGSAALSSAAYAARAGIANIVIVPEGSPDYRLLPLMVYGSIVLEYKGQASEALDWVHKACRELELYETTTYCLANPYQSEGPKTIAYEIVEQLSGVPDWCLVPVGGGGTLAGIWRGFCELRDGRQILSTPKMAGILPQQYKLLQVGLDRKVTSALELRELAQEIAKGKFTPKTAQAKLAMVFPPDGIDAINAIRDSGGVFVNVSDDEALNAQLALGRAEGIYVEISAAVSIAALKGLREYHTIKNGETVVALLCGSGFRESGELARTLSLKKGQVDGRSGMKTLAQLLEGL